jgi:hypothetical protein
LSTDSVENERVTIPRAQADGHEASEGERRGEGRFAPLGTRELQRDAQIAATGLEYHSPSTEHGLLLQAAEYDNAATFTSGRPAREASHATRAMNPSVYDKLLGAFDRAVENQGQQERFERLRDRLEVFAPGPAAEAKVRKWIERSRVREAREA